MASFCDCTHILVCRRCAGPTERSVGWLDSTAHLQGWFIGDEYLDPFLLGNGLDIVPYLFELQHESVDNVVTRLKG